MKACFKEDGVKIACIASAACAAIILCALALLPPRVCFADGNNHAFVLGSSSADCVEYKPRANCEMERLFLKDVCGESAEYADTDIEGYLQKFGGRVLFCETAGDSINYYCSAKLPYSVQIKGQTVNLQICVRENGVKLGTPIIFGGY